MLNSFCEEQRMNDDIHSFHEKELKKIGIPKWANINCPFCNKNLPLRSIRSIGLKLNTRNMGDLVVEIFCSHCSKMDTLYFRKEVSSIVDFCQFLSGEKTPQTKPFIEEEMYKMQYNNIVEKSLNKEIKIGEDNAPI